MHRRQICEIEFAFYVHYFTVCFIERLIDHGILVCEQALYFFMVASNVSYTRPFSHACH